MNLKVLVTEIANLVDSFLTIIESSMIKLNESIL
jgi:hypothetical protein